MGNDLTVADRHLEAVPEVLKAFKGITVQLFATAMANRFPGGFTEAKELAESLIQIEVKDGIGKVTLSRQPGSEAERAKNDPPFDVILAKIAKVGAKRLKRSGERFFPNVQVKPYQPIIGTDADLDVIEGEDTEPETNKAERQQQLLLNRASRAMVILGLITGENLDEKIARVRRILAGGEDLEEPSPALRQGVEKLRRKNYQSLEIDINLSMEKPLCELDRRGALNFMLGLYARLDEAGFFQLDEKGLPGPKAQALAESGSFLPVDQMRWDADGRVENRIRKVLGRDEAKITLRDPEIWFVGMAGDDGKKPQESLLRAARALEVDESLVLSAREISAQQARREMGKALQAISALPYGGEDFVAPAVVSALARALGQSTESVITYLAQTTGREVVFSRSSGPLAERLARPGGHTL